MKIFLLIRERENGNEGIDDTVVRGYQDKMIADLDCSILKKEGSERASALHKWSDETFDQFRSEIYPPDDAPGREYDEKAANRWHLRYAYRERPTKKMRWLDKGCKIYDDWRVEEIEVI